MRHHRRLPSMRFFSAAKRSKGTEMVKVTPQGVQSLDDGLVEECAVDAHLDRCPGQMLAYDAHTALDEGVGAVGVVDVSGAMVHVEHLVGLGDGAEQGVVAACAFHLLVEPDCGAFGVARGAEHRPVEVEGDAREPLGHQVLDDHRCRLGAYVADALCVGAGERAAHRGHVRQSLQAEHALDHLVVAVGLLFRALARGITAGIFRIVP